MQMQAALGWRLRNNGPGALGRVALAMQGQLLAYFFQGEGLPYEGAEAPHTAASGVAKEKSPCERSIGGADNAAGSLGFVPY